MCTMTDYNLAAIMSVSLNCVFEPGTMAVMEILEHHGWAVEREVEQVWTGFTAKIRWARRCARELTQYTHLMLIDARDVVVLASPDVIMERFLEFDHPWVCNAEPFIWPPGMYLPERYPKCDTPYRYLNSGAYIAEREHLLDCLTRWPDGGEELKEFMKGRNEDGPYFSEKYLNEPGSIKLDHNCELFQCMCGSQVGEKPFVTVEPGHVHNRVTDTYPLIIHFNGGTNIAAPDRRELWQHWV